MCMHNSALKILIRKMVSSNVYFKQHTFAKTEIQVTLLFRVVLGVVIPLF